MRKRNKSIVIAIILGLAFALASCGVAMDDDKGANVENTNTENTEVKKAVEPQTDQEVIFLDKKEAIYVLSIEDDYIEELSKFDYASKFGSDKPLTVEERTDFYTDKILEFSDDEKEKINLALNKVYKKIKELDINIPEKIYFIKSDGTDENNAAYTRGEYIVLPQAMLENEMMINYLVAHEFFHVYSRYNLEHKGKLYEAIKFREFDALKFPEELKELKMTNPDAPLLKYSIECTFKNEKYDFVPITYATSKFDASSEKGFFDYLTAPMMAVEIVDNIALPIYKDGKLLLVEKAELDDFYTQVGENTHYDIHPEEILAENFALFVTDGKLETPEIVDRLKEKMIDISK